MNSHQKLFYLSVRVGIVLAGVMIVTLLLFFSALSYLIFDIYNPVITLISALMLLLLLIGSWFWIYRPYQQLERFGRLVLEGYVTTTDVEQYPYASSPVSLQLFLRLWEMLNPSQMFQTNKRQAQYLALQNQINPHFLYNTLESIRSEALVSQLDSVADMTESLASFFRYTISKVENLVSVEEELQNCQVYFHIQEYRFADRLRLNIQYDPADADKILHCRMPKLSMQPVLENAIIHGIELKLGAGELTISLELTKKRLLIRISDNGVGMDDVTLAKLNAKLGRRSTPLPEQHTERTGGLALINVDERIRLLFGDEYGLHVFSEPNIGTDVELSLPAITSDRDVKNREVLQ